MSEPLIILASPTEWEMEADGVRCRLWRGVIQGSGDCVLLVHRVLTEDEATTAFVSASLIEKPYPTDLRLHEHEEPR